MLFRTTPLILARPAVRPAARAPAPVALVRLRALSATTGRLHKETLSQSVEDDIEKLKEDSLKLQQQGKGEWMAGLASDSEESVKADKDWDPPKKPASGAEGAQTKKPKP